MGIFTEYATLMNFRLEKTFIILPSFLEFYYPDEKFDFEPSKQNFEALFQLLKRF